VATPTIRNKVPTLQDTEMLNKLGPVEGAKFNRAYEQRNPLLLSSFAERGVSIAGKLDRVRNNPAYQKLDEKQKAAVRFGIYKKYVVPAYTNSKLPIPDASNWVAESGKDHHYNIKGGALGNGPSENVNLAKTYAASAPASRELDTITGIKTGAEYILLRGIQTTNKILAKAVGVDGIHSHANDEFLRLANIEKSKTPPKTLTSGLEARLYDNIQSNLFFHGTHPRVGTLNKASWWLGETLATLPLYEALPGAKILKSVGLEGGALFPEGTKSITKELAKTAVGKFVINRTENALDGYLTSLAISSGDTSEANKGAIAFTALGASGDVVASAPLIKKWLANVLSIGGRPLAEDLMQSHVAEVEHEVEKGVVHPKTINRDVVDPVSDKLHKGTAISMNSISRQMFDGKNLRDITKSKRALVGAKYLELLDQAGEEAPSHLPELHKLEVEHDIEETRKSNPVFNAQAAKLEKMFGNKVSDVVAKVEVKQNQLENGITSTRGTAKKMFEELPFQQKATLAKTLSQKIGRDVSIGELEEINTPRGYASHTVSIAENFKSYLRSPRSRADFKAGVGNIAKDNFNEFYDFLKGMNGDLIQFELPHHRILFNWAMKEHLPVEVQAKLLREAQKMEWYGVGSKGIRKSVLDQTAGWFGTHLSLLAEEGQLVNGEPVFASSRFLPAGQQSQWQGQLLQEHIQRLMRPYEKALARHPEALKGMQSWATYIHKSILEAKTPEEWLAIDNEFKSQIFNSQSRENIKYLKAQEAKAKKARKAGN